MYDILFFREAHCKYIPFGRLEGSRITKRWIWALFSDEMEKKVKSFRKLQGSGSALPADASCHLEHFGDLNHAHSKKMTELWMSCPYL